MKNILIIEDDVYKKTDIIEFINKKYQDVIMIDSCVSYTGGYQLAMSKHYDFYIIDMTIPKFDKKVGTKEQSLPNGGELLVETLLDSGITPVFIVMTQFENFGNETLSAIDARLKADCGDLYKGTVKYSTDSENWKIELEKILDYVIYSNN